MVGEEPRWGGWPRRLLWGAAILLPLAIALVTQLEPIQSAKGHFIEGLFWDIGKKDIVADLFAPIWAVSFIVLAALNRRLLRRHGPDPGFTPTSRLGKQFATDTWVRRSTWIATGCAVLLILLSWTREWERFGEQPQAFWFVLVLLVTFALTAVPLWWVRHDVERAVRRPIEGSRAVAGLDRYLFEKDEHGHARWTELAALAALTVLVAWVVLGQLDALLRGMHLTNQASYGIGSLAGTTQFDLSQKPAQVVDVVLTWFSYSQGLGPNFASGLDVAGLYSLVDTFVLIPSYTLLIAVLLLRAGRALPPDLVGTPRRSYDLLIAAGLSTLGIVVIADLVDNAFRWGIVARLWNGSTVANWSVRIMWAGSLVRNVGLVLLAAGAVVIIALRHQRVRGFFQSAIAVRGELIVLTIVALAFTAMPQSADVVRRWTVSVAVISAVFATALAVLLQWTSSGTLSSLQRSAEQVAAGETLEPARVRFFGYETTLRRLVVAVLFAGFGLQLVSTTLFDVPLGLRLGIPVALIAVLWLFGTPLPSSPFERGDRPVSETVRRTLPRLLGAGVLVLVGATVIRSAVGQMVFARHGDWWLLFALLPIAIGIYRLHTKTATTMGRLELAVVAGIVVAATWLIVTAGNPELSPVALTWTGLMLLYGAMPFFYSYDPASGPSTFTRTRLQAIRVKPIVAGGFVLAAVTALGLLLFPFELAPAIGTVSVVLLGAMVFAGVAAALVGFAEWTRPPDILAAFYIRRTPVFVLLIVWQIIAGGSVHDITVIESESTAGARPGITIDDVWERWEIRNDAAAELSGDGERPAIPMVFIASSGGGLRAAAWTGYVMDCLFGEGRASRCDDADPDRMGSVLVASGVSGGSIGLAAFSGAVSGNAGTGPDWVKRLLGDDFLAAAAAWLTLVDMPQSFLGFAPDLSDRSVVMERAFERPWKVPGGDGFLATGVFELWDEYPDLPAMVFNGTSVATPCRFNSSILDINAHRPGDSCTSLLIFEGTTGGVGDGTTLAATQDLVDYLCPGQDVKLSTAALLGARFPVITPSGRVGGGMAACGVADRGVQVVDGGYLEGSGAGTVMELWDHLEPRVAAWNADPARACIVPFFLQIDNGYENPVPRSGAHPPELLVPLATLLGSQFGRIANAREQAAIEFDLPLMSTTGAVSILSGGRPIQSRYARMVTRAHPGVQAPLGLTLSDASIDDLRNQLAIAENQQELAEVNAWFDGHLTCRTEV